MCSMCENMVVFEVCTVSEVLCSVSDGPAQETLYGAQVV
jgi:hypothetical protein